MTYFVEQTTNGLSYGLVVGLLALGFTLVFGTSHLINFAQGEVYMIGAFTGAATITALGGGLVVAIAVAGLAGAVVNVLIYVIVFYRIRKLPIISTLIAGLGSALVIRSLVGELEGVETKVFPDALLGGESVIIAGAVLGPETKAVVVVTGLLLVLGYLLLFRTPVGLAIRAMGDNAVGFESIGGQVARLQVIIFAIAGLLSGIAGVLLSWQFGVYSWTMGSEAIAYGFAATVIGGLGSLNGALIGGLAVGLVRGWGAMIDPAFVPAYPFIFLVLFLLVRPNGLFGKPMELH